MIALIIIIGIVLFCGIILYPILGMIVHDKIYFAVIDGDGKKAVRLFNRYKWLLSQSDRNGLKERISTFVEIAELALQNQKENNGN